MTPPSSGWAMARVFILKNIRSLANLTAGRADSFELFSANLLFPQDFFAGVSRLYSPHIQKATGNLARLTKPAHPATAPVAAGILPAVEPVLLARRNRLRRHQRLVIRQEPGDFTVLPGRQGCPPLHFRGSVMRPTKHQPDAACPLRIAPTPKHLPGPCIFKNRAILIRWRFTW